MGLGVSELELREPEVQQGPCVGVFRSHLFDLGVQ